MKALKEYSISFKGLKEGNHTFEYKINKKFFDKFSYKDFDEANVNVKVFLNKKTTLMEFRFKANGTVNVPCDLTNEPFDQAIEGELSVVVKFGEEYNDDDDEVLIISYDEYQVNIAQYIYELIILSVPEKRVHPKVLDGTMKSEVLDRLRELEVKEEKYVDSNSTDPRWDKLKDLLIK